MKTIAIHLDRLASALKRRGVRLKRTELLETLSETLGYHNSHEMTRAARRGDLDAPVAKVVNVVKLVSGETLMILRDPRTGMRYAIDTKSLMAPPDGKRQREYVYALSPYGGVVSLKNAWGACYVTEEPKDRDELVDALRKQVEDLRNRLDSEIALGPDWKAWEKDLKRASHKRRDPISDEDLNKVRFAVADNHCKSSEGERFEVRYREQRMMERFAPAILARLDAAEEELARLRSERALEPA